jgi:hypothetical protein
MYDETLEEFREWGEEIQKNSKKEPAIHEGHEPQGGVYDH